ncbi:MAG: glycosyltransferase family 4 protein [Candidatus Methylomirabilia bacterium]
MTTVLHTESSTGWGGQEVRILAEACWLREAGLRALLAGQPGSPILSRARQAGIEAIAVRMRAAWDPVAVKTLTAAIRREGITLIHTHSSVDAWLGGMAGRLARIPVVRSRHVSIPVRRGWNPVYSILAHRIVTSGEAIRQLLLAAGVNPAKVVTIPAGVDLDEFCPGAEGQRIRGEFSLTPPVIGSVAMFRGSKGHPHLLEAFTMVRREFPEASLLLVGDGVRRASVEQLVADHGLGEAVRMTGFRHDVPNLLRAMDCFVLASTRTEGVSQSLLQALATELPVVASAIGGIPEVIDHEVTGLLVPPGAAGPLAEGILTTLKDPEPAKRRAKAGRQRVEMGYSRATATRRLTTLYGELLDQ